MISKKDFKKISDWLWEIPKSFRPDMRVPARIYISEKMFDEVESDALQQLVNTTTMPGIVKYAIAMPDIHSGYGPCIGGVGAMKLPEGVISPGFVGYDENCTSPDSKILLENGSYVFIKELENFKNYKVKTVDYKKSNLESAQIFNFFKKYNNPNIYQILTSSGEKIEATGDHPIQTKEGMKEIKFLNKKDTVLIYPFKGVKYKKPSSEILLDENNLKKILANLGKNNEPGHAISQILNQLKSRNLLPLRYNSPSLTSILKLMGYIFGDGVISFKKNPQIQFYGDPEDLKEIQKDISKLGFKPFRIYSRKRTHSITTFYNIYNFFTTEHRIKIDSASLASLLIALGTPYGLKSHKPYRIPKWIFEAPLWQKRLFLAAFFGAELSKPKTLNKYNFYAPQLNMQKIEPLRKNGKLFLKDIIELLKDFKIQTYQIKDVPGYRYKGRQGETVGLRLQIAGDAKNLIKFWETIGYEYNQKKQKEACLATNYLRRKLKIVDFRTKIRKEIRKAYKKEKNSKKLFKKYSSEYTPIQFLSHSLFGKSKWIPGKKLGSPRIAFNFPSFDEFKERYARGNQGLAWDEIEKIEKIPYQDFVYDFTVNHPAHNFIANNFIVSNCGVRLLKSEYTEKDIQPYLDKLATEIQKEVPSGLGRGRAIKLSIEQINKILERGVPYLVEKGYGEKEDIENCEHRGRMEMADASCVSERAKNRGRDQVGTLGSGNHFCELDKVEEIFDEKVAKIFGLFKNQVVVFIHTGSRGLGHQNCTDYLRIVIPAYPKYGIKLPDKELACVPFNSPEGQRFFKAMSAACNYAWSNRHMIMHYVRKAWKSVLGEKANLRLLYDVAHNIAKIEEHELNGEKMKLIVHRKGATRAFPPGHPEIPAKHRETGQCVLIPGSMGTPSYVLVGTEKSKEAWYTVCFPGDTKILTNKGILNLKEIFERLTREEKFLVPSFDKEKYQILWKPIENVMKRKAPVIEISISQTGRSSLNKLRVTPNHKFLTLSGARIVEEEISEILRKKEMIFLLDNLPEYNHQFVDSKMAFLGGAIMSDGYVCRGGRTSKTKGRKVGFVQKLTPQKLDFINYIQSSFQSIFDGCLYSQRRKSEGYIRGELVKGSVIELTSNRIQPVQQFLAIKENLTSWVLKLSKEATLNFLAGIIDGDGSWHPDHKVINIFSTKEDIVGAVVIACLKLGILPYVSKQRRDNCYIIQISEKIDEIARYTKRVKIEPHLRKYGTKLFSVRQLFKEVSNLKWPFLQKTKRNSLMSKEKILKYLNTPSNKKRYSDFKDSIEKIISTSLRMQRVKKNKDLGIREVFNITVKDNHNYIVLTDLFFPVLVANCHGAGRTMSRHEAMRRVSGQEVINRLESKGIIVKCWSLRGIAEEAPMAYKDIESVVEVVHQAGLSKKVAKLVPLAVIKGE